MYIFVFHHVRLIFSLTWQWNSANENDNENLAFKKNICTCTYTHRQGLGQTKVNALCKQTDNNDNLTGNIVSQQTECNPAVYTTHLVLNSPFCLAEPPASISRTLSIFFCAFFKACEARLVIPEVSHQLILQATEITVPFRRQYYIQAHFWK